MVQAAVTFQQIGFHGVFHLMIRIPQLIQSKGIPRLDGQITRLVHQPIGIEILQLKSIHALLALGHQFEVVNPLFPQQVDQESGGTRFKPEIVELLAVEKHVDGNRIIYRLRVEVKAIAIVPPAQLIQQFFSAKG